MSDTVLGYTVILGILAILFLGIALLHFPKGEKSTTLKRKLSEAVGEWKAKRAG